MSDSERAFTPQKKTCCDQCPFARTTSKAYLDTRGDNAERFVGQANSNSILPCHMDDEEGFATVGENRQCAGAAKFRANIGVADRLHTSIGRLPADTETVFASNAELIAHHKGWTIKEAERYLETVSVEFMIDIEKIRAFQSGKFVQETTVRAYPSCELMEEHVSIPDDADELLADACRRIVAHDDAEAAL